MDDLTDRKLLRPPLEIADQSRAATTILPEDDEIFAAAVLVVGEDEEAYRQLYIGVWLGILPRDGYEKEQVRQIVNYHWSIRQLTRLRSLRQRATAKETLNVMLEKSTYATKHWKNPQLQSKKLALQVIAGSKEAREKAHRIFKADGIPVDAGSLISLRLESEFCDELMEQISNYHHYADTCMRRIFEYRGYKARLRALEADGN
jgi:hypothetical protein